jgi:hypothetical protein
MHLARDSVEHNFEIPLYQMINTRNFSSTTIIAYTVADGTRKLKQMQWMPA